MTDKNFIAPTPPAPKKVAAKVLLGQIADALDELLDARNIGSTIQVWELRRKMGGYADPDPITRVRKEISAFLADN